MMRCLTLLTADFSEQDQSLKSVLSEWAKSRVIDQVALIDCARIRNDEPLECEFASSGSIRERDLFELMTSQIWDRVTVVAARSAPLSAYSSDHFGSELRLLHVTEAAFTDNIVTLLRSCTVSIIETSGAVQAAFAHDWGIHLVQEPMVRIDPAVASQPMQAEHRSLLIALLASTVSGAFVWQQAPLLDDVSDPVQGDHKPVRVSRAFLRVVNAGRLTDEILTGAFPPSGPWSVPGDLANARAVPPGTQVPDSVIDHLQAIGSFGYIPLQPRAKPKGTKVGIFQGVVFFIREFASAIAGIPTSMVATVRGEIESWIQKVTFGEDSSILLRFDPLVAEVDLDQVSSDIQALDLADGIEAVSTSIPWETLQRVAFGLVDGGKYPEHFPPPKSGVHRLVYTDPASIGPSPTFPPFEISDAEASVLDLPDGLRSIEPVDVAVAGGLRERIKEKLDSVKAHDEARSDKATGSETAVQAPVSISNPQTEFENKKKRLRKHGRSKSNSRKQFRVDKLKLNRFKKSRPHGSSLDSNGSLSNKVLAEPDSRNLQPTTESELSEPEDPTKETTSSADQELNGVGAIERHIPGHPDFRPNEYIFVTRFYKGERPEISRRYESSSLEYDRNIDFSRIPDGNWLKFQTCDHCGTSFDHGALVRHAPTGALIHVGRVCAEKAYGMAALSEYERAIVAELDGRLVEWVESQSKSLLWRVGFRVHVGRGLATKAIERSLKIFSQRPSAQVAQVQARKKFAKWTRRGTLFFLLLLAASIASVVFTPLPILIFALILSSYAAGLLMKLAFLARDLVRVRYRLSQIEDEYERAFLEGRHAIAELLRLTSTNEQFMDWQAIIREIVHVPFGREARFDSGSPTIEDVRRPAGFVIASARPGDAQKMRPYLNARSQTMHSGWLSGIRDVLIEEWKSTYVNSRLLSPADNILPESDNASSESVVGRHPFSNEDVYYPRSDLRRRLVGGRLQERLVQEKTRQIAEDLRRTPIETLLGRVEVIGPGSALSGLPVRDFLSSLAREPIEPVAFLPDLISDAYPEKREMIPELVLPRGDSVEGLVTNVQAEPGVEFTAAAWTVEMSGPIGPLAALRAMASDGSSAAMGSLIDLDETSVS